MLSATTRQSFWRPTRTRLAQDLDAAIQRLVGAPSSQRLEEAKTSWLASREPYLQSEVFRFYDGPIDNPDTGPEGLINAWPLDEGYIDYVSGDEDSGVVNDDSVTIDPAALEALNEEGGEKNIATGYHAIEFLLWGQDLRADGPGNRPFTDYVSGDESTADNAERRGEYLQTVSSMLVGNLDSLATAWAADSDDNYRADFETVDESEALRRILTGMIVLSGFETGGERLQAALDTGDQEDEHSCFSDNTHRDMIQDIQGVLNVWQGAYERLDGSRVSGVGLRDVVESADSDLSARIDAKIEESLELANAMMTPFDQEILASNPEGRARVQALVRSLGEQEQLLQDVFVMFQLTIPAPD